MIEKLMNPEFPYGEPEYSEIGREINDLMERLSVGMNQEEITLLERLADLHTHRANTVARATFISGFCTAIDLTLDYLRRREA